jgi:hypothetical protein
MEKTTTAEYAFDNCFFHIVGPLTVTYGNNKYILTFQDDLSKYVITIPNVQQGAETVATAVVSNIVIRYGTPRIPQTDSGANFVGQVFRNTFKIKKIQSAAFHPDSQGRIQRSHSVLAEYLRPAFPKLFSSGDHFY